MTLNSVNYDGHHSHKNLTEHLWDVAEQEICSTSVQLPNLQQHMTAWTRVSEKRFQHNSDCSGGKGESNTQYYKGVLNKVANERFKTRKAANVDIWENIKFLSICLCCNILSLLFTEFFSFLNAKFSVTQSISILFYFHIDVSIGVLTAQNNGWCWMVLQLKYPPCARFSLCPSQVKGWSRL